jgi:hypothetical protein
LELHRKLTFLGVALLLATLGIQYYHESNHPGIGFNYAYVTGIAMLVVFMASFLMFNKDRWNESKS